MSRITIHSEILVVTMVTSIACAKPVINRHSYVVHNWPCYITVPCDTQNSTTTTTLIEHSKNDNRPAVFYCSTDNI